MTAVNPATAPRDDSDEQLVHSQAPAKRRAAGRLLETLKLAREHSSLGPTAQKMQEAASQASKQVSVVTSTNQNARRLFNESSKSTDEALAAFEKDLESTTLGQYTMSHVTLSLASLSVSETRAQAKPVPQVRLNLSLQQLQTDRSFSHTASTNVNRACAAANRCFIETVPTHSHQAKPEAQESNHERPHIVQETLKGKLIHLLEAVVGKPQAIFAEFCANVCLHDGSHCKNPWRDAVIGAATHIGMAEAIAINLPHHLPAYKVLVATHLVAMGAEWLEPKVARYANDPEVAYWFDRQYQLCGEGLPLASCHGLLNVAQVPSDVLMKVHHEITTRVELLAERFNITEETIALAATNSLALLTSAHNDPNSWVFLN